MTTLAQPPTNRLVEFLRDRFDIRTLIETGTYEGESTLWAAERFARVVTIDIRAELQNEARARCLDHSNVEFLTGDTRDMLPGVVASLDHPALFWLDAHAAPGMFGDRDDWPVLEELEVINGSPERHLVLIDDAHCFLAGSPFPMCPRFDQVFDAATDGGYSCRIVGDVIVLVPLMVAEVLDRFEART
jgi:hypothetical protein